MSISASETIKEIARNTLQAIEKRRYVTHYSSDKGLKGSVVLQAYTSSNGPLKFQQLLKGTVSVISSDPPRTDDNARFKTVFLKP